MGLGEYLWNGVIATLSTVVVSLLLNLEGFNVLSVFLLSFILTNQLSIGIKIDKIKE